MKETEDIFKKNKWISLYPEFSMHAINIDKAGYFDERPQLNFTLTTFIGFFGLLLTPFFGISMFTLLWSFLLFVSWGKVYLHLPINTGIDECETPRYGFYVYSHEPWKPMQFVWCWGMKTHHYDFPWSWKWIRTSCLKQDGTWEHETRGNSKNFWDDDKWKDILWSAEYSYTYPLNSGLSQERMAKIRVEEREWRWKWFSRLGFPKNINRTISIDFNDEVGERTGSWKGGVLGCGYTMKKDESPLETLRRMEKERKF